MPAFPLPLLTVSALLLFQAVPEPPSAERRNLLLITVDTLRPDALGWVAGTNTTPHLDRLAGEGIAFADAVSPVPITLPAHTAIMTGLVPKNHGVRDNSQTVPANLITLAEILQGRGYQTGAFVSGFPLAGHFGLSQGFQHYDDHFEGQGDRLLERNAAETTAAALRWAAGATAPWMIWVHYYDPHDPYEPPADLRGRDTLENYHGEVRHVDRAIGRLMAGLSQKQNPSLLTIFAADHGESLGEHGEQTHGFFIYQSTLAVPLVFHFPGRLKPARMRTSPRLVDILPTALELLALPPAGDLDGTSLVPLFHGAATDLPAVIESQRPWRSYGWAPLRGLRLGEWKLIAAPNPELYHLTRDPGEHHNLVHEERARAKALRDRLKALDGRNSLQAPTVTDPETLAKLRALGYVGAAAADKEPPPGLADPKDRIQAWNRLGEAEAFFKREQYLQAIERYDGVLLDDPRNAFALARSGDAFLALDQTEEAIARLKKAARINPDHGEIRLSLARAFTRAGQPTEAAEQWMELVRLFPLQAESWRNLADNLGLAGRPQQAAEAFRQALALEPEHADTLIRLAFAEFAGGRVEETITHLKAAAALLGEHAFPHSGALGLLYLRQGQPALALPWLARCRPREREFAEAKTQLALLALAGQRPQTARQILEQLLQAAPQWRSRLEADPRLAPYLP